MRKIRFEPCRMTLVLATCLCAFLLVTSGCVPLPGLEVFNAYMNKKLEIKQNVTDIQDGLRSADTDYFIGLALSGGGSRAANFGSAVLWELDRLGILQHVQYISTVSGGSLAGAYYVTFRDDPLKWNKQNLQQVMSQSFESWSVVYGLNPLHWPQYLGTSYNRSHLLEEVFSRRVFENKTFGDLRNGRPTLLLNATNYRTGERFVFSNYSFNTIRSDLGALPISVGVTASAAFPGIFSVVTLKDFSGKGDSIWLDMFAPLLKHTNSDGDYFHFFDGGVSDNLGVDTLIDTFTRSRPFSRGCLLILVDASVPYEAISKSKELNPRHFWDALIDTNALNATSILMQSKRHQQLKAIGFDEAHAYNYEYWKWISSELQQLEDVWRKTEAPEDLEAFKRAYGAAGPLAKSFSPTNELGMPLNFLKDAILTRMGLMDSPEVKTSNCNIWHIALNDLVFRDSSLRSLYTKDYSARNEKKLNIPFTVFQGQVGGIATRFKISDSEVRSLYMAADLIVNETNSKNTICRWLKDITGQRCTIP